MKRIKVFYDYENIYADIDIEKKVNQWIEDNPSIDVIQVETMGKHFVVLYEKDNDCLFI